MGIWSRKGLKRKPPEWPPGPPPWHPGKPPWVTHNPNPYLWLIISYDDSWWLNDKYIRLFTDIDCHLWLHYNQEGVIVHPRLSVVRGQPTWRDPHLGFNIEGSIEQEQAGDTEEHHFLLPYPHICKTYFYYFKGTVNGEESKSRSPFFSEHNPGHPLENCFLETFSAVLDPPPFPYCFLEAFTFVPDPPPFPNCFLEAFGVADPPSFPNCFLERWSS